MQADKIEFKIGLTIFSQPLRLVRTKSSSGQLMWELHRDEGNQRDDHVFITGLTKDVILRMAEAVRGDNI